MTQEISGLDKAIEELRRFWDDRVLSTASDLERVDQSARAQRIRFESFLQHHSVQGRSILDVGCGVAGLYKHLKHQKIAVDYFGVDISEQMIRCCREQHPEAQFECRDILKWETTSTFDYVVAIGIHNITVDNGWSLLEAVTRQQFELCRVAAYVSILTDRYKNFGPGIQAWSAEKVLNICLRITPYVTLRHDYLPNDFSVALYREPLIDTHPELAEELRRK
jgi:SAM-dependent methyltransferase